VESIITLAKKLKIKIVAEYVESEEIMSMIKELGIEYSQGYFIGTPEPEINCRKGS